MSIAKTYDPKIAEDKWYKHWQEKGYFSSSPDEREPFTIVIPPPNVTGVLHMPAPATVIVRDSDTRGRS